MNQKSLTSKFRSTKNRNEILNNISTKFKDVGSFMIWQNSPNDEKRSIHTEVKFISLNIKYNYFTVSLIEEDLSHFRSDIPTYFVLKNYDFVFKTQLISISPADPKSLLFKIPKDIYLEELRKFQRTVKENINIGTIFIDKNTNNLIHTICPIMNISQRWYLYNGNK